ncbi:hypothetical protein K461DRAFT_291808 [Myriangium duriaei CBS 260.36]|uniref:t-SNARE coiled-coil homology domain-containing protein n=1 Tax=Myriangium duriaei CBS 260.36 TaxID=1168546 RepID=A0A9P4MM70_9PEZI|nr:hypothetical protein K461DRAFT_291808 [Myriangium duriaei CBS 260.36]
MASRFHQRDNRSSLFSSYDAQSQSRSRPSSAAPAPGLYRPTTPNSYAYNSNPSGPGFSAYPTPGSSQTNGVERSRSAALYEKKGHNTAVLDELESQNDAQVSEMSKRVTMLKDITLRIGDEIRDSTALAEKMNDQFGSAGTKLKGTMNRMLRMAQRTGVGWKVWLGFFAAVILLFWYVWLF